MAAMWRSCGNDRQKDAIARGCPLSRVSRISRCRRDRCALRYDQQFVISGRLPSQRGKLGQRGRAYRRQISRRSPGRASLQAFGAACDAAQADMIAALASKGSARPSRSTAVIRSIFKADGIRPCRQRGGFGRRKRDARHRDQTTPARSWRHAAMVRSAARRRGKPPLHPRGGANSSGAGLAGDFFSYAPGEKARYGRAT
jgi:hypothetical protein